MGLSSSSGATAWQGGLGMCVACVAMQGGFDDIVGGHEAMVLVSRLVCEAHAIEVSWC
jgi:hypothetical protein